MVCVIGVPETMRAGSIAEWEVSAAKHVNSAVGVVTGAIKAGLT